jgi:uncharacterized iron-regulated membrane protein
VDHISDSPTAKGISDRQSGGWQRWLHHPERVWVHRICFQIHYGIGVLVGLYVAVMSVSGGVIVYRNELTPSYFVEWLVHLHSNLLAGSTGRFVNGIGALCLTSLCLTGAVIWWPGIKTWRRSTRVSWGSRIPRLTWDLHSALGFWIFPFVLMWAVSGTYFSFSDSFNAALAIFDPNDKFYDSALSLLSAVHFGRLGWFSEAIWSAFGLALALLSISGVFVCCHRMIYKKTSNPNRQQP